MLKRDDGWYVGCWTNLAAGIDNVDWSHAAGALEIFSLKWAFAIAPLYGCKVVVRYPAKKLPQLTDNKTDKVMFEDTFEKVLASATKALQTLGTGHFSKKGKRP